MGKKKKVDDGSQGAGEPREEEDDPQANMNLRQSIGSVTGGSVNMVGVQHNYGTGNPHPPTPSPSERGGEMPPGETVSHDDTAFDVFLSYSRKDEVLMRRVRDDLRAAGLRVWTDEALTPGTPSWKAAIEKAIENTATLVVLLSPESKQSEWVRRELAYADAQKVRVIPALARGDEGSSVPLALIEHQRVDLQPHYEAGVKKVIASARK